MLSAVIFLTCVCESRYIRHTIKIEEDVIEVCISRIIGMCHESVCRQQELFPPIMRTMYIHECLHSEFHEVREIN